MVVGSDSSKACGISRNTNQDDGLGELVMFWGKSTTLGDFPSLREASLVCLLNCYHAEQNKHLSRGGSDVKPLCHPHLRPVRAPVECLLRFGPDTKAFFCGCSTRTKATQSISHQILHYYTIFRACFFFHDSNDLYSWEIFQCGLVVIIEMAQKRFFFGVVSLARLQVQPSACACAWHSRASPNPTKNRNDWLKKRDKPQNLDGLIWCDTQNLSDLLVWTLNYLITPKLGSQS